MTEKNKLSLEEKTAGLNALVETSKLLDHPLEEVFELCIHQLTKGKGEDRHGKGKDFMDQPWKRLADVHGYGFLTGQAEKKLEEAQGFEDVDRWNREMYGVIIYAAMAILYRKLEEKR